MEKEEGFRKLWHVYAEFERSKTGYDVSDPREAFWEMLDAFEKHIAQAAEEFEFEKRFPGGDYYHFTVDTITFD